MIHKIEYKLDGVDSTLLTICSIKLISFVLMQMTASPLGRNESKFFLEKGLERSRSERKDQFTIASIVCCLLYLLISVTVEIFSLLGLREIIK